MRDKVYRVYRIDSLKNTVTTICYSRTLKSVQATYGKRSRYNNGRYIFYVKEELE